MMLALMLLAQSTDPISGGAGWAGAGLLGLVLGWLTLKHLPDKDKLLTDLIAKKDAAVEQITKDHKASIDKLTADHRLVIEQVIHHCEEESKSNRAAGDRHHEEQMQMLQKIHLTGREAVHATRGLQQQAINRTRLADAFQSTEVAGWTKSLDGTVLSWNLAAERMLGWKQGEITGKSVYDTVIPPDKRDEEKSILQRIGAGDTVEEYETERLTRIGRRIHVMAHTSPIRDVAGKVIGASTLARPLDH